MSKYRYSRPVLLEMAVAVEESARDFYNGLGEKFTEHKPFFKELVRDEESHAERYAQLLGQRKVEEIYSTEEERMQADYNIQVLEDSGYIGNLRKGAERAREVPNLESALEAAVQLEKDTLLFYHALAMGLGKADRQEIYKIIRVEHSHLYRIEHLTL